MNRLSSLKPRLRAGVWLAVITIGIYAASFAFVRAEDTKPADSKTTDTKSADSKPEKKSTTEKKTARKSQKKLTGAELYAINCNRCHPERYATEFTSAQWKTLMTHMRVRANLPAAQAREILKYLQEDSGN